MGKSAYLISQKIISVISGFKNLSRIEETEAFLLCCDDIAEILDCPSRRYFDQLMLAETWSTTEQHQVFLKMADKIANQTPLVLDDGGAGVLHRFVTPIILTSTESGVKMPLSLPVELRDGFVRVFAELLGMNEEHIQFSTLLKPYSAANDFYHNYHSFSANHHLVLDSERTENDLSFGDKGSKQIFVIETNIICNNEAHKRKVLALMTPDLIGYARRFVEIELALYLERQGFSLSVFSGGIMPLSRLDFNAKLLSEIHAIKSSLIMLLNNKHFEPCIDIDISKDNRELLVSIANKANNNHSVIRRASIKKLSAIKGGDFEARVAYDYLMDAEIEEKNIAIAPMCLHTKPGETKQDFYREW
ncbi:hypothetical protein D3C79_87290 [compost metagenome]